MRSGLLVPAAAIVLVGCVGESEPALRVGAVTFDDESVRGSTVAERELLADLAAIGQVIAREETAALAEPLVARSLDRSRLLGLPYHLAARSRGFEDGQLRELYERDPEWQLTVRHLVRLAPRWAPAGERAEAARIAEEARQRAVAGEDFPRLAAEYSEEPGAAERGGRLEPGRRGTWVEPFWDAAVGLQPGEISPVVETEYGFHVIRLEDRAPIAFRDADRTRLLTRVLDSEEARAAMEGWVIARAGALAFDSDAAEEWFPRLQGGEAPRSVVLARWFAGLEQGSEGEYTAWDAALFRASLPPEARDRLETAGGAAFAERLDQDARETMLSVDALRFGVSPSERVGRETTATWEARVAAWAQAFGFRPGMTDEQVAAAALRARSVRGQEQTIARQELFGIRPLLRRNQRVSGSLAPPSATDNSSSTP